MCDNPEVMLNLFGVVDGSAAPNTDSRPYNHTFELGLSSTCSSKGPLPMLLTYFGLRKKNWSVHTIFG